MKILSYNISWECMTNSSQGSAGNLGKLCVNNVCLKNVASYINYVNKKLNFIDIIAFQEIANEKKLFSEIDGFDGYYYTKKSKSGPETMITCFNKKLKLIRSYCGSFKKGRPYQILEFPDFFFVNLHYGNRGDICDLQKSLSYGFGKLKSEKNKLVFVAGDFNFNWWIYQKNRFQISFDKNYQNLEFQPFTQIPQKVYLKTPVKTCCSNSSKDGKKMRYIGDFVMTPYKNTKNVVYYKNMIKGLSSDHYPVLYK
mgnify:CR=1 FL=1